MEVEGGRGSGREAGRGRGVSIVPASTLCHSKIVSHVMLSLVTLNLDVLVTCFDETLS